MPLSIYDKRLLLAASDEIPRSERFLANTFFGRRRVSIAKSIEVHVRKRARRVIDPRNRKEESQILDKDGFKLGDYEPPYLSATIVTDAEELINRQFGESSMPQNVSPEQVASQRVMDEMTELDDALWRTIEKQCSKALFEGKVDGRAGDISFGKDSDLTVTLSGNSLWSDTTNSDPLKKIQDWRILVQKKSGIRPDIFIASPEALRAFLNHPKVQKLLDTRRIDVGALTQRKVSPGVDYYGNIPDVGDVYLYNEFYNNDSGDLKSIVPEKKVLLGSSQAGGILHFGSLYDPESNQLMARDVYFDTYVKKDPPVRYMRVQSAPLPVPVNVDAFLAAKVLS